MKIFALIVLIFFIFFYFFIPTSAYQGPPSDHFNGKTFVNLDGNAKKSFLKFLTWQLTRDSKPWPTWINNQPPAPIKPLLPQELKLTFINHATVLIQMAELNILTDPIWSYRASPFSWIGPARVRNPGISFTSLPHIDVVLISHNHYDHLDIPTLKRLENQFQPLFLVPLGNESLLRRYGIKKVIELDWWQAYFFNSKTIFTFLPTQHWSARWLTDRNKTLWGSFGIKLGDKKIYFAGDSGYASHYKKIRERWGSPDIALLPIGAYKPRWFMKEVHLNPKEAVAAHLDLGAKQSIAIHYGTFKLGDEGIEEPVNDLKHALKEYGLSLANFLLLAEGQAFILK
ncbi:MBL fold metallo-hydrolase [Legionella sp. CNM-1927-20]|uniref:MBL fold metallo-hydrolase n=1 Tax=Legionella sp. CNM-1927-20 TaxID=3422221 RepID=UPI00403B3062